MCVHAVSINGVFFIFYWQDDLKGGLLEQPYRLNIPTAAALTGE